MTPIVRVVLDIRTDLDPGAAFHQLLDCTRHATDFIVLGGSADRQGSPDGETPQAETDLAGKRLEAGEPQTGSKL